jgi:deazaflavin-dependent oxidoreductase (nitroreductase family)
MGKAPVILVTTTGRKTGRLITTPLCSVREGDAFIVIASNGGRDWHPSWWLNLLSNPEATVEFASGRVRVRMEEVTDRAEKDRLWKKMTAVYAGYDGYTKKTSREVPLALLKVVR